MNSVKTNAILRIASIITFFLIWHLSSIFVDVELLPGPYEVSKKIIEEAESSELIFSYIYYTKKSYHIIHYSDVYWHFFWIVYGKK